MEEDSELATTYRYTSRLRASRSTSGLTILGMMNNSVIIIMKLVVLNE